MGYDRYAGPREPGVVQGRSAEVTGPSGPGLIGVESLGSAGLRDGVVDWAVSGSHCGRSGGPMSLGPAGAGPVRVGGLGLIA